MEKGFILQTSHSFLIFPITWSNFQASPHQSHGVSLQKSHPGKKFLVILSSRMSSESPMAAFPVVAGLVGSFFPIQRDRSRWERALLFGQEDPATLKSYPWKREQVFSSRASWAEPDPQAVPLLLPDRAQRDTRTLPLFFPSCRTEF